MKRTVLALVVLIGVVAVPASPASAADKCQQVGTGYVCMWEKDNYAGDYVSYWGTAWTPGNWDSWSWFNRSWDDKVSSIKNRGKTNNTRHYEDNWHRGDSINVMRGGSLASLGNMNDEISSSKWW